MRFIYFKKTWKNCVKSNLKKSQMSAPKVKKQLNKKFLNNNSIRNKFKPFLEYKINKLKFKVKFQFQLEEFKSTKLQPIFFAS